jgi:amino-acid N-acetyltransferase
MSTVFNFTFVPWFRSVAPYIHMHRNQTFVVGCRRGHCGGQAAQHCAGPGADPEHGRQDRAGARLSPAGERAAARQGARGPYSHGMRITDSVALDCAQEAAGQLRYEIEAAFSQGLPNTPMAGSTVRVISGNFITARPVGIVDGVDFSTRAWCARWTWRASAHAGHGRAGAAVAVRLLAHRRGLQPDHGRSGHQRGHCAAGRQADFSDRVPGIRMQPASPSEDNPIDTELPLAAAAALLATLPPRSSPPTPAFTCSTA